MQRLAQRRTSEQSAEVADRLTVLVLAGDATQQTRSAIEKIAKAESSKTSDATPLTELTI